MFIDGVETLKQVESAIHRGRSSSCLSVLFISILNKKPMLQFERMVVQLWAVACKLALHIISPVNVWVLKLGIT